LNDFFFFKQPPNVFGQIKKIRLPIMAIKSWWPNLMFWLPQGLQWLNDVIFYCP
jgi:hypothetical protein